MSHEAANANGDMTTPEWRLLERLTLGWADAAQRAEVEAQLRDPRLQWGQVLDLAIGHKLVGLLARTIADAAAWDAVPGLVAEHLRESWRVAQHRQRLYQAIAADVTSALRAQAIPVACTKGIVLATTAYGGRGARYLGDIDLMAHHADGERIAAVLSEMGFAHGYVDRASGQVCRHSRQDVIAYRLNPDHLLPFVKAVDDIVFSTVQIDVACSFTWARSAYQMPIDAALRAAVEVEIPGSGGRVIPALSTEYLFLFTVLHLFREAWGSRSGEAGRDVNLMKFGDIIRLWQTCRPQLLSGTLRGILDRFDLAAPVGWVLVHADRTFGLDMARALGLEQAVTEAFLSSAGWQESGQPVTRRGSMTDWLASTNRPELFTRG